MHTEIRVGSHLFRFEPPDIGHLLYFGDLDGPTAMAISEQTTKITRLLPQVFLIVDLSHIGSISSEARRSSATSSKDIAMRGTAIVGASLHVRVLATLVARASNLLSHNVNNPTRFFATEAEARKWIALRRSSLEASKPSANS